MKYFDFTISIKSDRMIECKFDNKIISSKLLLDDEKIIDKFIEKFNDLDAQIDNGHVKDIGKKIRNMLFPPNSQTEKVFVEAVKYVDRKNKDGKKYGLRILLNLDKTEQKFLDYPWEMMVHNEQFLAADITTPIVRILSGMNQKIMLDGREKHLLALYSNIIGEYAVNTDDE